jgi:nucleoside-diphosphate-sugar epimerase
LDVSLSEQRYHSVNVDGTINLLKAARAAGVRRFVHCSSVGVMGDIKNPPADETYPCNPTNIYEKTKLAGERAVLKYSLETDFPVVVVRPAWVYGPRCPRTQKLFRAIGKRRFPIFGDGQNLRHPIYVTDCVRGLELCAESDQNSGEIYIIAGSEPVTIEELTRAISNVLNVPAPKFYFPLALGKLAGSGLQLIYKPMRRRPPFSKRSLDVFQKNNAYDISKASQKLGFAPQFDLYMGLEQTLRCQDEST